jgi:hypothetical protein
MSAFLPTFAISPAIKAAGELALGLLLLRP